MLNNINLISFMAERGFSLRHPESRMFAPVFRRLKPVSSK